MPTLTRRRSSPRHDSWHVYYGDIQVGTIGRRSGVPLHVDQWDWTCGIMQGMHPRDHRHGTGADIDECRAAFKKAWERISPTLTEDNFQEWRDQRDFTAWKYE